MRFWDPKESYLSYLYFLGYIYLFILRKWGNGSLFRYAEKTKVKTKPESDRGEPRPDRDRDRDLDRMVCQKPDRDRDRPTLNTKMMQWN